MAKLTKAEMEAYRNELAGGESAASTMTPEERERLRYYPDKDAVKKAKADDAKKKAKAKPTKSKGNRVMMSEEEKERLRYRPEKAEAKKKKAAAKAAAEKKEAKELGVSVESLRAMKAEAANEASAAEFAQKADFSRKSKYNKGGMATKANCGASMKPTQKSTGAVKMACGGMAYNKSKK